MKKLLVLVFSLGIVFTAGCAANTQIQTRLQKCQAQNKALVAQIEQIKEQNKADTKKKDERIADFIDAVMTEAKKARIEMKQTKVKLDEFREKLIQQEKTIALLKSQNKKLQGKIAALQKQAGK